MSARVIFIRTLTCEVGTVSSLLLERRTGQRWQSHDLNQKISLIKEYFFDVSVHLKSNGNIQAWKWPRTLAEMCSLPQVELGALRPTPQWIALWEPNPWDENLFGVTYLSLFYKRSQERRCGGAPMYLAGSGTSKDLEPDERFRGSGGIQSCLLEGGVSCVV